MPLEKHFSRDLLNEGAVAAEIVAETISFASIDAGSKWLPELGLPVEAVAASARPAASMATADDPPLLPPPRPLASSFETERPPPV